MGNLSRAYLSQFRSRVAVFRAFRAGMRFAYYLGVERGTVGEKKRKYFLDSPARSATIEPMANGEKSAKVQKSRKALVLAFAKKCAAKAARKACRVMAKFVARRPLVSLLIVLAAASYVWGPARVGGTVGAACGGAVRMVASGVRAATSEASATDTLDHAVQGIAASAREARDSVTGAIAPDFRAD